MLDDRMEARATRGVLLAGARTKERMARIFGVEAALEIDREGDGTGPGTAP